MATLSTATSNFSALVQEVVGKTAEQDVNEYRRRSPAWSAEKLQSPLLIHTTTNDEDVNVLEVEHHRTLLTVPAKGALLDLTIETHGAEHSDEIVAALAAGGYQIVRQETP